MITDILERLVRAAGADPFRGAGEEIENFCRRIGLNLKRQPVREGLYNLILPLGENPQVLISAHFDTVPAVVEGRCARMGQEGSRFYGRGSCDALGSIAALLGTLQDLAEEGFDLKSSLVLIAFTVDEEEGGEGSVILQNIVPASIKWALVLEPTSLKLALAEMGTLEYRVKIKGKTAHGSLPERGHNPLLMLFEVGSYLQDLAGEFNRTFNPRIPLKFIPLKAVGGSEALAIPGKAELKFDFRVPPEVPLSLLKGKIEEFFWKYPEIEFEVVEEAPPFQVEPASPFVEMLARIYEQELGHPLEFTFMPSWTDAHNFYEKGWLPVIWGPGDLAVAHTEEEHVEVAELLKAQQFLTGLLRYLSQV
ncbi:acetylornithine deacetylase [Thermanaeromonas toyohensis ToBE]|uniref:Acetylornithine deacetylase n=1 Tax=Thermanaeromonas toyohensis ToBE TaxID=698762 RepID=A0A1W1VLL9_9FIRM|nr:M20/M25/M40 family metallo-hydrolase [Thermanaeromonas toyohensis]SMB94279.1 acetylornithine deacetylase [Thermanaeromonas toyohensis ToBE]